MSDEGFRNVTLDTIKRAYKPFDIVTNAKGAVGFIQEVNVNDCQPERKHQISYAVNWLLGSHKHAWLDHVELTVHCNLFVSIAESTCHAFGGGSNTVKMLFNNMECE